MTPREEGWNIVLAGYWNRSIFLPEWVFPRLFPQFETPGHEVTTEVALLSAMPLIYRDNQVRMEISGGRLAFRPQILNDECLSRSEAMARAILQALPETPVQGVGINFGFREQLPPGHVVSIFNDVDDLVLREQGWSIGERKLSRKLTRENDIVNLVMAFNGEVVLIDFNFSTEVGGFGNAPAQRAVEQGNMIRLREIAVNLLRDNYHLELEGNDDGNGGQDGE